MKFWSKRNYGMAAILWMLPLFSLFGATILLLLEDQLYGKNLIALGAVAAVAAFAFHLWYNTYYRVEDGKISYQVGIFSGSVSINQIESIQRSEYLTNTLSPAMGLEGLLIRYRGGRRVFISPTDEIGFMQELQKVNGQLKILPQSQQAG